MDQRMTEPLQTPIKASDMMALLKRHCRPDDLLTISPYRCVVIWRRGMYYGHVCTTTQKFYRNDGYEEPGQPE